MEKQFYAIHNSPRFCDARGERGAKKSSSDLAGTIMQFSDNFPFFI